MTIPSIPDSIQVERRAIAAPRSTTLQTGIYVGALLIAVMVVALFIANRVPGLERYALERNAAFCGLFVIFMFVPLVRYWNRPMQMFISAMIGWGMFVVAYDIAGMFYQNLFQVLRAPFEALIEGAVIYGVAAVGSWVGSMCLHARHAPVTPRRRRTDHLHQQP
jgi:hypothetical protein